jgi:hypothetical protein
MAKRSEGAQGGSFDLNAPIIGSTGEGGIAGSVAADRSPGIETGQGNSGFGEAGRAGNPDSIAGAETEKTRTRRPYKRRAQNTQRSPLDLAAAAKSRAATLLIIHAGLASVAPEMAITSDQADAIALAMCKVESEFGVNLAEKYSKWEALIAFITVCGGIYGPRISAINERKKAEKAAKGKLVFGPDTPAAPLPTTADTYTDVSNPVVVPLVVPDGGKIVFG